MATKILKRSALNPAGRKRIQASSAPAASAEQSKPSAPAQARIVSQADGHVVIQVVCSCGQEIQLRCATQASA